MEPENRNRYVFAKGICFDKLVWVFLVTSFLGALIEMVFCFVTGGKWMSRSSVLYGTFSFVWGFGAVVLTVVRQRLAGKEDRKVFLAGFVVGVVDRPKMIGPHLVREGDVIAVRGLGKLPSVLRRTKLSCPLCPPERTFYRRARGISERYRRYTAPFPPLSTQRKRAKRSDFRNLSSKAWLSGPAREWDNFRNCG